MRRFLFVLALLAILAGLLIYGQLRFAPVVQ